MNLSDWFRHTFPTIAARKRSPIPASRRLRRRKPQEPWDSVFESRPAITREMLRDAHVILDRLRRDARLERAAHKHARRFPVPAPALTYAGWTDSMGIFHAA